MAGLPRGHGRLDLLVVLGHNPESLRVAVETRREKLGDAVDRAWGLEANGSRQELQRWAWKTLGQAERERQVGSPLEDFACGKKLRAGTRGSGYPRRIFSSLNA